jgi:holo-[acyl-carrier protein] synthase
MCLVKYSQIISLEQKICLIDESLLRSLLNRSDLFSLYEQNYCQTKPTPLLSAAGIWCAKQAFIKVTYDKLGFSNFGYLDLEIRHHATGQPVIQLQGDLANWFKAQNINTEIAIAHTNTLAVAIVLFWVCGKNS